MPRLLTSSALTDSQSNDVVQCLELQLLTEAQHESRAPLHLFHAQCSHCFSGFSAAVDIGLKLHF